jgi:alkylation response protein AidB-like acyl-CoA dehydrogenase
MNFDFSDDLKMLREQARKFLAGRSSRQVVRKVFEGGAGYDAELWAEIARMGWLGTAVPEEYGGAAVGYDGLCVLAEELGYVLAPVPFSSSIYLAAEAILIAGSEAQKQKLLPPMVDGSRIGTFALAEGLGNPSPDHIGVKVVAGKLSGTKLPVPDGEIAHFAVVAAIDEAGEVGLYAVELGGKGVSRSRLKSIDPARSLARIVFDNVPAERLEGAYGYAVIGRLIDRAAILIAFEQVGGAQACLDMAKAFAMERYAFGRPIASFQAIKHKLADVYVAIELARSNAYYGAWALAAGAPELPVAAAAARVAATEAFHLASKENIQTHGGIGFTWEADCHFYYRRSKLLAAAIGSAPYWKDRLIAALERRNAP